MKITQQNNKQKVMDQATVNFYIWLSDKVG